MADKKIDWSYWEHKYISSDLSLDFLSKLPNAPTLNTLKKQSTEGLWRQKRQQFKEQTATAATQNAVTQAAVRQAQQIIDAAELLQRHLQMAKALQSIAASRLKSFSPSELSPKDLVAWVNAATNIERLALGLATERVEVQIDFSQLTDEQLERLAAGEDPRHLLN